MLILLIKFFCVCLVPWEVSFILMWLKWQIVAFAVVSTAWCVCMCKSYVNSVNLAMTILRYPGARKV